MTGSPATDTLFEQALGLASPWYVDRVDFDKERRRLDVHLAFERGGLFTCASCEADGCKAYDSRTRSWRHLNCFEHEAYLHAPAPRIRCPQCGVRQAALPWARPRSGFTLLFEGLVVAMASAMPVAVVARLVGEHDTRLWRIVKHHVGMARTEADFSKVVAVGVDEKAARRGHDYVTLFADLDLRRLLFATTGRTADVFAEFRRDLEAHGGAAEQVDEICMDMSKAYMKGARDEFPDAEVTFDRFHVVKLLNEVVESVRRAERKERPDLENTRWLWLKNRKELSESQKARLDELLAEATAAPDTVEAYKLEVEFQDLWDLPPIAAERHLERWCKTASESGLAAMATFAEPVRKHEKGILRWFHSRITNGLLEAMNSLVQAAKARARGYRTTENLIAMAYLICGKLQFNLTT